MQVYNDVRTGISAAAVFQAVLVEETDRGSVEAETFFNVDVTSFDLNNREVEPIISTPEAVKILNGNGLSPAYTEDELQHRSCSLMTLISAAGTLDAAIVYIKDEKIVAHSLFEVNSGFPLSDCVLDARGAVGLPRSYR